MNSRDSLVVMIIFVLVILIIAFASVPSNEDIKMTVENAGYSDVAIANVKFFLVPLFRCSPDDIYYFDVISAVNPNGKVVENMYVCAGMFKGHTIRYK